MILVNGSKGIGTGFSTDILSYNPETIIHYLQQKLQGNDLNNIQFTPYFEGFKGSVHKVDSSKYITKGIYEKTSNDTIVVSELPIGSWTDDFKELLESLMDSVNKQGKKVNPYVKSFNDMSKSTNVYFEITFCKNVLEDLEHKINEFGCNAIEKILKLYTTYTTTNMHMFDENEKLRKYQNVSEIINNYYDVRLSLYDTRKKYLIDSISKELVILRNKKQYIEELLNDTIDLRKKKKEVLITLLEEKGYDKLENDEEYWKS
jgi:DNA topoisomerase-2